MGIIPKDRESFKRFPHKADTPTHALQPKRTNPPSFDMPTSASDTESLRKIIATRLSRVCDDLYGGVATRMAEDLGESQSKISRLLAGKQKKIDAYLEVASKLAERHSGISIEQLTRPSAPATTTDKKEMRVYEDVEAGAGNGLKPMNEWKWHPVLIPEEIMRSLVGQTSPIPDEIGILRVQGESMYPEIKSGDWIMFTPASNIADGATYLVRLDGALLVKVIQRKAGRRLRIHSLNSKFEDDYIRKCEHGHWVTDDEQERRVEFEVVGRFLNVIQPKDLYAASQRVHDAITAYHTIQSNGES